MRHTATSLSLTFEMCVSVRHAHCESCPDSHQSISLTKVAQQHVPISCFYRVKINRG